LWSQPDIQCRATQIHSHQKAPRAEGCFWTFIRRYLEQGGYSQEALAHRAGYHRNYIGQLGRGEKSSSLNAIFNFANVFGRTRLLLRRRWLERCMLGKHPA
jgi:DNA-binding XRE family transcriptional regulator